MTSLLNCFGQMSENHRLGSTRKPMWQKIEADKLAERTLSDLHAQSIKQMMNDPVLTAAEKEELLRQLDLPDEDWLPVELPLGAEPISETIIRMRQGERV